MTDREVCKHGHVGWMHKRYQWYREKQKSYWTWRCAECARIWAAAYDRRNRKQAGRA